jgi:hypothetical protein
MQILMAGEGVSDKILFWALAQLEQLGLVALQMQLSVKSSVTAWLKSETGKRVGKRMAFSFLALWVHVAVLFFLTMTLFAGKTSDDKIKEASTPPPVIKVILASSPPEETPPPQVPPEITPQDMPPLVSEKSLPLAQPKEITPKDGIYDCESLTTKPRRFVLDANFVDFKPDEDVSGHVQLHLTIHRDGTVIGVRVEKSTMTRSMTDKIAANAGTSIFQPGEIGGVAVDCDMKFDFSVTPPNGTSNRSLEAQ